MATNMPNMDGLDEDQRRLLGEMLSTQAELRDAEAKLSQRQLELLQNPSPNGQEELQDYIDTVITPLRMRLSEQADVVMKESFDLERVKDLFIMAAEGASGTLNVTMLKAAVMARYPELSSLPGFGEMFKDLPGKAREAFKSFNLGDLFRGKGGGKHESDE